MFFVMKDAQISRLFYIPVSAIFIIWFVVSLSWPMGRDQGILAWVGDGILQGRMPFRDLWDVKGPGAYYAFALVQLIFGHNMWGVRVFDACFQLLGIYSVAYATQQIADQRTSFIAGTISMFLYMTRGWWNTSQPDGWCGLLIAAGIALIALGSRQVSNLRYALFGCCIGLCFTEKPLFLILLLPALPPLWRTYRESARSALRSAGAVLLGFAVPVLIMVAYFASKGCLGELFSVVFIFNAKVHTHTGPPNIYQVITALYNHAIQPAFCVCLVAAALGVWQFWAQARPGFATLMLWLGCNLVCVLVQNKYYLYQMAPLFPPLAILSAVGIRSLDLTATGAIRRSAVARALPSTFVFCGFVVLFGWYVVTFLHDWTKYEVGKYTADNYADIFQGVTATDHNFRTLRAVCNYIEQRTTPSDTVEVWGWDPIINYLTRRAAPTRFGYDYPLQKPNAFEDVYRAEFLKKIESDPPRYVLVPDKDDNHSGLMNQNSLVSFFEFKPFLQFVLSNYDYVKQIDEYRIWRLRANYAAAHSPQRTLPNPSYNGHT